MPAGVVEIRVNLRVGRARPGVPPVYVVFAVQPVVNSPLQVKLDTAKRICGNTLKLALTLAAAPSESVTVTAKKYFDAAVNVPARDNPLRLVLGGRLPALLT
jgi:hypothetical protein